VGACPAGFVDGTCQFTLDTTGAQGRGYHNHFFHHWIRPLKKVVGCIVNRESYLIPPEKVGTYRSLDKNDWFAIKCQVKMLRIFFLLLPVFWKSSLFFGFNCLLLLR
jgi:hypothetical protein